MIEVPHFLNYFMILKWIDFIEIFILSSFLFYFSKWLKQDKTKKLLPTFYSLCLLFILSDYLGLLTISTFLFSFAPALIMLFILLHQNTIQQNFIATKNITPAHLQKLDWISELIKAMLTATDFNKEVCCLIECQDSICNFVIPAITMNTKIQKDILEFLIESSQFEQEKFLWINQDGTIKSINTNWNLPKNLIILTEKDRSLSKWQQEALKITSKLDVLAIKNSSTRTFEIIAQGKIIDEVFTDKAINIIEQFIKKNKNNFKNEAKNENKKSTNHKQLNS